MSIFSVNTILVFIWQKTCRLMPEQFYLKILYRLKMGKKLNLVSPKTMNEKLQWLKLNNRKPELTVMADKVRVKEYVAKIIGEEHIIPTLGVWNHFDEIPIDILPSQFVLKTNHSGGSTGVVICKNKEEINWKVVKRKLEKSLKRDISYTLGEWPYRNIKRKILAETYMGDDIIDYKFYCFNGYADVVLMCLERSTGHPKFYFFDRDWRLRRLNIRGKEAPDDFTLPKPEGMDEMFRIASVLSEGIPFVRVDLYYINDKVYFGEMTFYPDSGYDRNRLPEADNYFGDKIILPTDKNLRD